MNINEAVAIRLANSNEEVAERVISHLVEEQLAKRVDQLSGALAEQDKLTKDGYRLAKPDVVTYDVTGTVASGTFSKERIDTLKKHNERLEKVTKAIELALGGDFKKINELGSGK